MQPSETIEILPIEHASGIVRWGERTFAFDPTGDVQRLSHPEMLMAILVTDIHGDHLSTTTLAALGTAPLIVPEAVYALLPADLKARARVLKNDESLEIDRFRITAIPMYNLPDAENKDRHTKGRGNGYLVEKDGTRVYIAGDTAGTPEMRALTDIDIALVPMNLPYTMGVEEAADAVLAFKPKTVYPYHYRTPDGFADVAKFKQLVDDKGPGINVVLADWYPNNRPQE